ncbi:SAP30-binding protein-like [Tropilaelaps mercedesae]|uniref:SAP30-binding protein-like n=1 Tax=Tropilaelaps mercedesae TaxID=418985 RepID=A0A1V9Y2G6_9ACAR|nr:SAP30-binding protein-like [Tropilaelaps mercedesae]
MSNVPGGFEDHNANDDGAACSKLEQVKREGRCSQELQSRISDLCQQSQQGISLVETIEQSAEFRHPRSYERLVLRLGIDAGGSNFPKEVFNPHELDSSVMYENLIQARTEYNNNEEKLRNVLIPIKDLTNLVKRAKEIKEITMQKKSPLAASFGAARTTPLSIAVPGLVQRKFQGAPGSSQRPELPNEDLKSLPEQNAFSRPEDEPHSSKH